MRDIEDYEKKYLQEDFEEYQVEFRRKKMISVIKNHKSRAILEIGCGMEPLFKYLPYEDYDEYTLIEPANAFYENALEESRKIYEGENKICCLQAFFEDSQKCRNMVNKHFASTNVSGGRIIVCSSLLHEVENPDEMVEALYNVCDDKSTVVVNVPNAFSFHRILSKCMNQITDVHEMSGRNISMQQHSVFDMKSLEEIFLKHGFSVIEKGSYFVKPFTHGQMLEMMKSKIINMSVLEGLYNMIEYLPDFGSEIYIVCKRNV